MTRDRDDLEEGRADTDASLGVERDAADDAIARAVAHAEREFDALIARDRVLADRGVTRFRERADDSLADERSASPEPSSQVVQERRAADAKKQSERSVTDEVHEHERHRADERGERWRKKESPAHVQHEHAQERQITDERLSTERSEADTVLADRDASQSALENARDAEVDRADVFAMVTHDLRNPLCVILGNADIIAESAEDTTTRAAADDITRAAARMGRLVTDLLDLARIDGATFVMHQQSHSVSALLSEMRESYLPVFAESDVSLSVVLPAEDIITSFDYDRVVQMLSNLLGNSMKFTPRGGQVDLHVEHDSEELVFVVRDNGAGIKSSALPHLFERFWQLDPDARRGLGLGLYLCRTIARAHGGDISVQSEVGAGSTFRVWLPLT